MTRRRETVRLDVDVEAMRKGLERLQHRSQAWFDEFRVAIKRQFIRKTLAGVMRMLQERPELRGVVPLADVLDESVRWSA